MVTPQAAVDSVRYTETLNERSACEGASKEWVNPSKYLVDKALERWSTRKMRADNTSVVIIMLDPPGPPKRDVLKSSAPSYSMDYLDEDIVNQQSQALEIEPIQNFTMFDHSTNEHIDMDGMPLPTSGLTVLTRYENITESDVQKHNQQQAYENALEIETNKTDDSYMNSFAESYNSILNTSLVSDQSYSYSSDSDDKDDDDYQFDETNTTHQYDGSCSSHDSVYSLTKLQTRSEQQYGMYDTSTPSTSHAVYTDYQQNLADHNYIGCAEYASTSNEYPNKKSNELSPSTKRSLSEGLTSTLLSMMPSILRSRFPSSLTSNNVSENTATTESCSKATSPSRNNKAVSNKLNETSEINDNSIQINEISSSDSNESISDNNEPRPKRLAKKIDSSDQQMAKKVTRSAAIATVRITRSGGVVKKSRPTIVIAKSLKTKTATILQKQPNTKPNVTRRTHKENIAEIVRKLPLESIVGCTVGNSTRAKKSLQQGITSRTLRSQNALTKDPVNRASNQRTVVHASAGKSVKSNIACNTRGGLLCKKLPKRLLNESVQMIKSNNNNNNNIGKQQKRSASPIVNGTNKKSTVPSSTLRWKVLVAKKPLIATQCNQLISDRTTIITRRTRLQQ